MPHLKFILIIFIWVINTTDSLQKNGTVSFPTKITNNNSSSNLLINNTESVNSKNTNITKMVFQQYANEGDVPDSLKMGFYFFIGLSIAGILFILIKINRMRLSRAERKYGVHGDRTTQELTPLPMAVEDDSDNEDHTVFDINRPIRVS